MTKRPLPDYDRAEMLEAMGICRDAMIKLRMGSPNRSLGRACADAIIANIDELAYALTGESGYFRLKGHARINTGTPRGGE